MKRAAGATLIQLTPGMVVGGDFRVVELLSAGGMGAVYVAEQLSTGKRRAVKVMHPQLVADPKLRERFEQEARVGALIASDHVVEVIAAGVESPSGMPWIAMELLEGEDLATHVQRHGIPSTERLREIVRQLCHALGAAHAAGVVHRDLKPENIFLSRSRTANGRPSIKVLDFGIAKVVARARTTATAAIGTPAWMSPEQTDPRAGISPATDVWALGLIVYWLMTGRPYWIAAGDPSCSMHAVMREILFDPMAPASARAEERGAAERLPPGFDAWFDRCVTREPKARFATATELLGSFEQICNGFDAEAIGPPASIAGSLAHDSTAPLSTRSYLAGAGRRDAPQAPTGSAFVAPSPGAAEANDRDGSTVSRSPSTRRTMILGTGIGLLAAAAAVFMVRGLGPPSPARPTTPEQSAPTGTASADPVMVAPRHSADLAILSATATAIPMASAEVIPSASSVTPIAPVPKASAERSLASTRSSAPANPGPGEASDAGAAGSPTEALPPFDLVAASTIVERQSRAATFICKHQNGPKLIGAVLYFKGDTGTVLSITMDRAVMVSDTGFCVRGFLQASRVAPFRGEGQGLPVSVILE